MSYPCNKILRQSGFQSLRYITTKFHWAFPTYWNHRSNLCQDSQFALLSYTIFCSISDAYDSLFSAFSSIFGYVALGSSPIYPILIHHILNRAVGRLGMVHTMSEHEPYGSCVFRLFPNRYGTKFVEWLCTFSGGELGPHLTQCCLGRGLPGTKWHLHPSSHFTTIDLGWKLGEGCWAPFWGEMDPHLTQCRLDRGLPPYKVASWSIQPFGHNWHGPKFGGDGAH